MDSPLILAHAAALQHLGMFIDPVATDEQRQARLLEMRPHAEDFERVFKEPLLAPARALYDALWRNPPPLRGRPEQTLLWIRTALSDDFVAWNRRGQEFPGGYRKLAPGLQPQVVWVAWKLVAPGDTTGLSFDGLTWLDGRFAWFPQPWRLVPMG